MAMDGTEGILSWSTVRSNGHAQIILQGEVDLNVCQTLSQILDEASDAGVLVIDMKDLEFIDSSGIRCLLDARSRVNDRDACLILRCPSEAVRRVLAVAGVEEMFTIEG